MSPVLKQIAYGRVRRKMARGWTAENFRRSITLNEPQGNLKKMDAKLKKIQITPVKFDKDGDIKDSEFATLTLEVPMNSTGQRAAIIELCELLDQEWVTLEIGGPS